MFGYFPAFMTKRYFRCRTINELGRLYDFSTLAATSSGRQQSARGNDSPSDSPAGVRRNNIRVGIIYEITNVENTCTYLYICIYIMYNSTRARVLYCCADNEPGKNTRASPVLFHVRCFRRSAGEIVVFIIILGGGSGWGGHDTVTFSTTGQRAGGERESGRKRPSARVARELRQVSSITMGRTN